MDKNVKDVKVLTFEEWVKNPEVALMKAEVTCDECNGTGEHECECGDTHTCGYCDGDGKSVNFRETYEQTLRDEIERLRRWVDGVKIEEPSENLIPNGHTVGAEAYLRISMPGKTQSQADKFTIAVSKETNRR